MKVRVVTTASKAQAVQVICYRNNRWIVIHHVGSAHTEEALNDLMILAEEWIRDYSSEFSLFPDENPNNHKYL